MRQQTLLLLLIHPTIILKVGNALFLVFISFQSKGLKPWSQCTPNRSKVFSWNFWISVVRSALFSQFLQLILDSDIFKKKVIGTGFARLSWGDLSCLVCKYLFSLTCSTIMSNDARIGCAQENIWLVVPTFDTKVTEYLCSGWVFFLQTNFDFLTSHFWQNFFISFESYRCLELKFEKIFHLWSFFVKLWGFKDCHFDQFGTINAWYNSRY